jgi:hypothetical protein
LPDGDELNGVLLQLAKPKAQTTAASGGRTQRKKFIG